MSTPILSRLTKIERSIFWVPLAAGEPDDPGFYLVCLERRSKGRTFKSVVMAWYSPGGLEHWYHVGEMSELTPPLSRMITHWAYLPKPP